MVANGYARTYRVNSVLTASPGQLVLMLYDGVLQALAITRDAFDHAPDGARRIEVINHQLMKAQAILQELQGGLNHEAGGEFARTMHSLYDYHVRRLFEANLRKQMEPVIEIEQLVRDLRDAWAEMLNNHDGSSSDERVRVRGVA